MRLVTKKVYAQMCGMPTNQLSVSVSRNNVIATKDGYIDLKNEINAAFLEKRQAKNGVQAEKPAKKTKNTTPKVELQTENKQTRGKIGIPELPESQRALKYHLAQKTETEAQIAELKLQKQRGEVVPVAPLISLWTVHNKHVADEMRQLIDVMVTDMGHKYSIPPDERAVMRGQLMDMLNAAIVNASTATEMSVDVVISDFADKRGRGERL